MEIGICYQGASVPQLIRSVLYFRKTIVTNVARLRAGLAA